VKPLVCRNCEKPIDRDTQQGIPAMPLWEAANVNRSPATHKGYQCQECGHVNLFEDKPE
jgi:DNA-directed RNA polymerase subunit RPC12/RpoP